MPAKYLLGLFAAVMLLDLLLPYLLAPFYAGYSHRRAVMSALGNPRSPVRRVYNCWLVLGGFCFSAGAWAVYRLCRPAAPGLSLALLSLLWAFALGALVLSGFFSVGQTKQMTTPGARIRGYGASLGFLAPLFAPLLLVILSARQGALGTAFFNGLCFVLALVTFVLFVLADKPRFAGRPLAQEGAWQRLTLLFMYLPLIWLSLRAVCGS